MWNQEDRISCCGREKKCFLKKCCYQSILYISRNMAEKVKEACVCKGGLKSGSQVYNYINQYFWGGKVL